MIVNESVAVSKLKAGEAVALPTETVYGLAASIFSDTGLRQIFATKKRPFFDPLIVHVTSVSQARDLVREWPDLAEFLSNEFWPGPLTLILPKSGRVNPLITAGLDTVALRHPRHPITERIINQVGAPLAAPSANLFGKTSPTRAEHVEQEFGGLVSVVDGGPSQVGLESTVVQLIGPSEIAILRPGGVSLPDLQVSLNRFNPHIKVSRKSSLASPGSLKEHYQPKIPLVLIKGQSSLAREDIEDLASQISPCPVSRPPRVSTLTLNESPALAARELYHDLRCLSQKGGDFIVCYLPEEIYTPAWAAILDRLSRASSLTWPKPL